MDVHLSNLVITLTLSFLLFSVVEAQPACRDTAVNAVTFDVTIEGKLRQDTSTTDGATISYEPYAQVTWTVDNSQNAVLDGFAVHFADTASIKDPGTQPRSIEPTEACHSGSDYLWVNTSQETACDRSDAIPECAKIISLCLCPQPNCTLFFPTGCLSVLELLGPNYNYHLTILPTTRILRYPIKFNTSYEFSISPYYRQYANLNPGTLPMSPVLQCDESLIADIRDELFGAACIDVNWTAPQNGDYFIDILTPPPNETLVTSVDFTVVSPEVCGLDGCTDYTVKIYEMINGRTDPVFTQSVRTDNPLVKTDDAVQVTPAPDSNACTGADICDTNADCTNISGSVSCVCNTGFLGDGLTCTDTDECGLGTDVCHDDATCTNTIGSFRCTCNDGFAGSGVSCIASACATVVCPENASCVPVGGSTACLCNSGYNLTMNGCEDIDECSRGSHDCDPGLENCKNTDGSFQCESKCGQGLTGDGNICLDIDECSTGQHSCDSNADCTNIHASYLCKCRNGFNGNGFVCKDVRGCSAIPQYCDINADCVEDNGTITCTCIDEPRNTTSCQVNNVCETVNCPENAFCNFLGNASYNCMCNPGYSMFNITCNDINECSSLEAVRCHPDAFCTNTDGSYTCTCEEGFIGDGFMCEELRNCDVTQTINGLTFPPTIPGFVGYSTETCEPRCPDVPDDAGVCGDACTPGNCSDGWICCVNQCGPVCTMPAGGDGSNAPLASMKCEVNEVTEVAQYDISTFTLTTCDSTIEDLTQPPYVNIDQTLRTLSSFTINTTQLNQEDVNNITAYFTGIADEVQEFTEEEVEDVAEITSHLTQYYGQSGFSGTFAASEKQRCVESVTAISRKLTRLNGFNTLSDNINIGVNDIADTDESFTFKTTFYAESGATIDSPIEIQVPSAALADAASSLGQGNVRAVSIGYRNSYLFPSEETTEWVIANSLGNETTSVRTSALTDPVVIINNGLQVPPKEVSVNDFKKELSKVECVFWDFDTGSWSTDGCSLVSESPVRCECDHLTNFAILVSKKEIPANVALSVVSYVGCGLSIICLVITIIVICVVKRLRAKHPMKIMVNLCACLALSFAFFIFGVDSSANKSGCDTLTIILHYFLLATWFWMAMYSYTVYRDIVKLMESYGESRSLIAVSAIAYGVPFIIVALNAGIALGHIDQNMPDDPFLESSYRARNYCWLRHNSLYFGFLLPVGLLLLFNIVVFCMVLPKITCRRKHLQSTLSQTGARQGIVIAMVMSTTMGLSWVIGYLMLIADNEGYVTAMSWLFAIINSFQGVFIFYFLAIRSGELKRLLFQGPDSDGKTSSTASTGFSPPASPSATM